MKLYSMIIDKKIIRVTNEYDLEMELPILNAFGINHAQFISGAMTWISDDNMVINDGKIKLAVGDIELTNLSNEVKTIRSNQTIVTLMFYRVTGCDKEIKDNTQNRDDLMPREFKSDQFEMDINDRKKEEFLDEINQIRDSSWKKDYKELIKKVRKENNIEKITTIDIGIMIFYLLILVISVILFLLSKIDISLLITIIIFDIPFIINSIKEIYLSKRRD